MHWLKRNLFLAVTALAAVLLLGGGIFFILSASSRNKQLDEEVEQTRSQLNGFYGRDPFPHQTNIDSARKQATLLRAEVQKLAKHFAPVPVDRVDSREFLSMRDRTLSELREAAQKAGVGLPATTTPYAFSFDVQRAKVRDFGAGTFPTVPEQMAEVKALCAALYEARVSRILNVRRAKASTDDEVPAAPQQDYTPGVGNTTNASVHAFTHPFEVTFTCFSAEITQVLSSLARSPYGFLVKAVQVEPETGPGAEAGATGASAGDPSGTQASGQPGSPRPLPPRPGQGGRPSGFQLAPGPRAIVRPGSLSAASDGPVVLLKERRLRVTMLVYAIRPAK
jgi:hypothetical protein